MRPPAGPGWLHEVKHDGSGFFSQAGPACECSEPPEADFTNRFSGPTLPPNASASLRATVIPQFAPAAIVCPVGGRNLASVRHPRHDRWRVRLGQDKTRDYAPFKQYVRASRRKIGLSRSDSLDRKDVGVGLLISAINPPVSCAWAAITAIGAVRMTAMNFHCAWPAPSMDVGP
jgi:hypothetical protein